MKKLLCCVLIILAYIGFTSCFASKTVEYTELRIPLSERYSQDVRARCPWDIYIYGTEKFI